MWAELRVFGNKAFGIEPEWGIELSIYVTPRDDRPVVFPHHLASVGVTDEAGGRLRFRVENLGPETFPGRDGDQPLSLTIAGTQTEAIVRGPGLLKLYASCMLEAGTPAPMPTVRVELTTAIGDQLAACVGALVPDPSEQRRWLFSRL